MDLTSGGGGRPTLKRGLSQIQPENQKKPRGTTTLLPKAKTRTTRKSGQQHTTSNTTQHTTRNTTRNQTQHTTHNATTAVPTHTDTTASAIPTQNRYDILHEQPAGNGTQNAENNMQTEVTTHEKKVKTAPIVVVDYNATDLQNTLNECIASKKFELRMMKVGIRVNIPDTSEHSTALNTLKTNGVQYYMYHTAATRPVKVVLYGLHDMRCEDLKTLLKVKDIEPEEVKKLNLRKPNYKDQAVYLLYFKPGSTRMDKLREVKDINHIIVRWEKYHPRSYDNVAQCRNCQKLGHSSVNCNLAPKCLLCAEEHKTDDCMKRIPRQQLKEKAATTTIDRTYVKCSNCGNNHTANYQGCNARKEFIAAQQRLNERRGKRKPLSSRSFNYETEFPTLNQQQYTSNPQQPEQSQSWANVVQQSQQNSTSDVTTLQAIQGLIGDMRLMMTQMMKMMEIFFQHVAPRP